MKDKMMALNLNSYRNNHHAINNNIKRGYEEVMREGIEAAFNGVSVIAPIEVDYTLYVGTRRKLDIANVLCIVDKSFLDCLVQADIIEDDNYEFVTKVVYRFGGYDKDKERVEIKVKFWE